MRVIVAPINKLQALHNYELARTVCKEINHASANQKSNNYS